jgi:hypothetical protein
MGVCLLDVRVVLDDRFNLVVQDAGGYLEALGIVFDVISRDDVPERMGPKTRGAAREELVHASPNRIAQTSRVSVEGPAGIFAADEDVRPVIAEQRPDFGKIVFDSLG